MLHNGKRVFLEVVLIAYTNLYNFARNVENRRDFCFMMDGWSSLLKKPHEKLIMKPEAMMVSKSQISFSRNSWFSGPTKCSTSGVGSMSVFHSFSPEELTDS